VGKQRTDTGLHDWCFEIELSLAILFGDRVVALDGDGSERLLARGNAKANPDVVRYVNGSERQEREKNSNSRLLHRQ